MIMITTLYVLRRPPDEIPRVLFHPSDVGVEVVLIEQAGSISYDDLVEKIFRADRTIVI